ncbi:MAG: metallophosphoesterase [Acidimicrobiia bacterium]
MDLTTVADDLAVFHDGVVVHRFEGLEPGRDQELLGRTVRTLARPEGELLCRFTTVNDVHFGEEEAGRIDDEPLGPIQRPDPGEPPFPETMNRAAVAEMVAIAPAAVIVKGDLTADGTDEEFEAFESCYRSAFGDRLAVVRGNHDSYRGQNLYAGDARIDLPGVTVALIDTAIPEHATGRITPATLEFLDELAASADRPVIVMGHHQQWVGSHRAADYFGINPDDSDALTELVARRRSIVAYTAGHTHRHRVRRLAAADDVPSVEVGCVKDFPGTWAEYRVYEGGIMQVVHRVSSPEALAWSERCRHLYSDFGVDYESYALGDLEERCFVIPPRR